jgi:hypothetical protein
LPELDIRDPTQLLLDVVKLSFVQVSFALLALDLLLLQFKNLIEALEADRMLQLNILLLCEVLDAQSQHVLRVKVGGADVVRQTEEDGVLLQEGALGCLALSRHLLCQYVVGLLQIFLGEELLD